MTTPLMRVADSEARVRRECAAEVEHTEHFHKLIAEDEQGRSVHARWCTGCRVVAMLRGEPDPVSGVTTAPRGLA